MTRKLFAVFVMSAATLLLQGCWFIFIPGSVISSISDSVTGDEGAHCVGESAKVGDKIKLPGGAIGTVKSLSGVSTRCKRPEQPIRALLVF